MTYEDAFNAGVLEGLERHKLSSFGEVYKTAFLGAIGRGVGGAARGVSGWAGNASRGMFGGAVGAAAGLAFRDKDEDWSTTLGRMGMMGGIGAVGGYYAKPAWNSYQAHAKAEAAAAAAKGAAPAATAAAAPAAPAAPAGPRPLAVNALAGIPQYRQQVRTPPVNGIAGVMGAR